MGEAWLDLRTVQFFQISFDFFCQCRYINGPGKSAVVPCRGGFRGLQYSLHGNRGNTQSHGTLEVASGLPRSPQCGDRPCNRNFTEGKAACILRTSDQEAKHGYTCNVCYCNGVLAAY